MIASKKFDGYCAYLIKKVIATLLFQKFLPQSQLQYFCLKSTVLKVRQHLQSSIECVNFTRVVTVIHCQVLTTRDIFIITDHSFMTSANRSVCVRACVYVVHVCQRNVLSYPEISINPVQLSLEINFLKQKSVVNTYTHVSECFHVLESSKGTRNM